MAVSDARKQRGWWFRCDVSDVVGPSRLAVSVSTASVGWFICRHVAVKVEGGR